MQAELPASRARHRRQKRQNRQLSLQQRLNLQLKKLRQNLQLKKLRRNLQLKSLQLSPQQRLSPRRNPQLIL